jgi:hypothetical protein
MNNFVNYDSICELMFMKKTDFTHGVLLDEVSSLVGDKLPPAGLPAIYLSVIVESSFKEEASTSI